MTFYGESEAIMQHLYNYEKAGLSIDNAFACRGRAGDHIRLIKDLPAAVP